MRTKKLYWHLIRSTTLSNPTDSIHSICMKIAWKAAGLIPPKLQAKFNTTKKAIYRFRAAFMLPSMPRDVMNLSLRGTIFDGLQVYNVDILFDDGVTGKAFAVGTDLSLKLLRESDEITCELKFLQSSPRQFRQMIVINGKVSPYQNGNLEDNSFLLQRNHMRSLVYIFTTSRHSLAYEKIFRELKDAIEKRTGQEFNGPKNITIDFEYGLAAATKKVN